MQAIKRSLDQKTNQRNQHFTELNTKGTVNVVLKVTAENLHPSGENLTVMARSSDPLKSLPEDFTPQSLELNFPDSLLEHLWSGIT